MKVILSNAGVLPTTLKLYQPDASNGVYGTVNLLPADDPANKEWADRYRKAFNLEPDYSAAEYYDGVMMVAAAIEKAGTDKDALVKELRTSEGTRVSATPIPTPTKVTAVKASQWFRSRMAS